MGIPTFRMQVVRAISGGEQVAIDINSWNPVTGEIIASLADMEATYQEACKISDMRFFDMHMRIIEQSGLRNYFTQEEWSKLVSIMDLLAGRQTAEGIIARWEAIKEENAALEVNRMVYTQAQQFGAANEVPEE